MASMRTAHHLRLVIRGPRASGCVFQKRSQVSITASPRRTISTRIATKYPDPTLYEPASIPPAVIEPEAPSGLRQVSTIPEHITPASVLVTLHNFPQLEPISLLKYPSSHLSVPLRKDILHRAVIFEGDAARQGTANSKWRNEVRGSGRKLHAQKGTGKARVGDKKSPIRRGGGVAHGPKPRDFSTDLPRKVYDLAWRTALSYRYNKGQLVVIDKLQLPDLALDDIIAYIQSLQGEDKNRLLMIGSDVESMPYRRAFQEQKFGKGLKLKTVAKVDVKNLLELDKVIIEKECLDWILRRHQSDLRLPVDITAGREQAARDTVELELALAQLRLSDVQA